MSDWKLSEDGYMEHKDGRAISVPKPALVLIKSLEEEVDEWMGKSMGNAKVFLETNTKLAEAKKQIQRIKDYVNGMPNSNDRATLLKLLTEKR